MAFFGVYIPPSKTGFEGTTTQCSGSIAADSIKTLSVLAANDPNVDKYEDPEYPPDSPLWLIFTEKSKALDVLRHYKEARLREFPNREQAESYVQFGFESIESLKRFGKAKPSSKPVPIGVAYKTTSSGGSESPFSSSPTNSHSSSLSNMITTTTSNSSAIGSASSALSGERPPFRAPTKQELVEFRKQIEAGNYERVKRIVWDNPRFLISSGDTPTSLKEGYRYNAMHICAQGNQAIVAELILKIISDRDFTQLYAGKKSSGEMCAALNENLLDYYLNMPDKGRGETPLHFAVKNGHIAVVEVLTSYPQCKSLKNTEGKYPKEIICERAPNAGLEVYNKLMLLLSEPYYVPVLRATHNQLPPHIGQPFTPIDPPIMKYKSDENDRLSVDLTIGALAGPMPKEKAFNFYRRWKTPPRIGSNTSPLSGSSFISPIKNTPTKTKSPLFNRSTGQKSNGRVLFGPTTPNKSINNEANGNQHNKSNGVGDVEQHIENNNNNNNPIALKRNWSSDLPSTPIRQMRPDLFLEHRSNNLSLNMDDSLIECGSDTSFNVSNLNDSFRERHIKNSDVEKGLEVIGRQLARQDNFEWREYWDFLDTFIDIASSNGLTRLESYLASQVEQTPAPMLSILSEKSLSATTDHAWNFSEMHHYIDMIQDRSKTSINSSSLITQVMTPYTCVEKSLQVFAKRITKTLINNINNMVSINDTLLSELKRLKSLIVSFKDDARFITVNFSKVHSRISHLVASYIAHSMEVSEILRSKLLVVLRKLLQLNGDRREDLHCVCTSMLLMLEQAPTVQLPDALKTEELCLAAWQLEQSCACPWDANLSRKTSRRKRTESLRAQVQDINIINTTPPTQLNPTFTIRNNTPNDEDIDSDDETFYFECDDGGDSSDDEEIFRTPPQSRSPSLSVDLEPRYELFIYGKEPTKRDLDVLSAVFHVKTDKETLPFVHAWRTAMENFTSAEMDLFPSPKIVQKTHRPITATTYFPIGSTPKTPNSIGAVNSNPSSIVADSISHVHPKRLFATPKLNAVAARHHLATTPTASFASLAAVATAATTVSLSFQTPLNKVRGLFSKYRETRQDASPVTPFAD